MFPCQPGPVSAPPRVVVSVPKCPGPSGYSGGTAGGIGNIAGMIAEDYPRLLPVASSAATAGMNQKKNRNPGLECQPDFAPAGGYFLPVTGDLNYFLTTIISHFLKAHNA